MIKISEYENEEALDLLADIIDPATEIFADAEIAGIMRGEKSGNKIAIAKAIIKNHKKAILQIMARLNNTPVEEFKCNIFTLPMMIIEVLNDESLMSFFTSQAQTTEQSAFGSATENSEATGVTLRAL